MGSRKYALAEIAEINSAQYSPKEKWPLIQYLDTGSVTRGHIDTLQQLKPGVDKVPGRARRKVKNGSIVYSMVRPNQEHYALLSSPPANMLASTGFAVIDAKTNVISPEYLYYALIHPDTTAYFQALAEQVVSTYPTLGRDDLARFEIDVPSLEEQRAIAALLTSFDEKITLNQQTNDYLHDMVMAASKSIYWEIEATDGALPDGWRWVEVDEIAELVSRGITPKYDESSDEIILGQTCVRNNLVLLENGRRHKPKKITEKWLREGDLLINSTGVGSLGRTAQVWFQPEKLTVDSHITIVRTIKPEHALYLGFWAFAHERYIESLHTGSTGQTELPRDHVKSIRLVLPDETTLSWFNSIAAPAVKAIVANQSECKKLAALRDALLPRLMSGEIDVSQIELTTQPNNHL